MRTTDVIDGLIEAHNRRTFGAQFQIDTSSWALTQERWQLFVTFVELLDRAVRAPLAPGSAAVLLTATVLHEELVVKMAHALSWSGAAIYRHAGSRVEAATPDGTEGER